MTVEIIPFQSNPEREAISDAIDLRDFRAAVRNEFLRAEEERAALCAKFPNDFEHGYRTGYLGEFQQPCDAADYPIGFHTWDLIRKNAWWAGWNLGNVEREAGDG
jgi:hypothetical protein